MATFRIRDLIVAVGRGWRVAGQERAARGGKQTEGDDDAECECVGCLAGTHAVYACLKGPSVVPLCGYSDPHIRFTMGACYGPSVAVACGYSDPDRQAPIGCMSADELKSLKRQLAKAIEKIEKREEKLRHEGDSAARSPQTVAEVDALESELAEAIEELKRRRTELQRAGSSGA